MSLLAPSPFVSIHRLGRAVLLATILAGCTTGELGGALPPSVADGGAPVEPDERPVAVDPQSVSVPTQCSDLGVDERLVGVSPEGDAWLAGGGQLRVLNPLGGSRLAAAAAPFERVDVLRALDDARATAIADGHLWTIDQRGVEAVYLPPELGEPLDFCGSPARPGPMFLVTSEGLFERVGERWWGWDLGGGAEERVERIANVDGSCAGPSGHLWVRTDRAVWRLGTADGASLRVAPNATVKSVDADATLGAAVHDGSVLRRGHMPLEDVRFAAGDVERATQGGGRLWVLAGDALHRFDGSQWVELESSIDGMEQLDAMEADGSGGLWLGLDDEACHVDRAPVRLRGLRPYARYRDQVVSVTVDAPAAVQRLIVRVDGELIIDRRGGENDDRRPTPVHLGAPGWHRVTATVTTLGNRVERSFEVEVLPSLDVSWDEAVRPIYENSCADCHQPGGIAVDLSTYDAWANRYERIEERVITGQMPPSPEDPLTSDEVATIRRWIEGGRTP